MSTRYFQLQMGKPYEWGKGTIQNKYGIPYNWGERATQQIKANLDERRDSSLDDPIRTLRYEDLKTIQEPFKYLHSRPQHKELWRQLGIVKITRHGAEDI